MGISLGSINTGLPKDIVKQIIDAEKVPIKKMQERKSKVEEKKGLIKELTELVQSVKKNLINNSNARSLTELKVDTNNELVDVNVDKNIAGSGNYQFEIVQLAQKSSALSSGFEDPEKSYTGVGFIQYELPNGETRDLYVDSDNASLKGIAQLINRNIENGMRANVVNDGSSSETPWRLLISLESTGAKSRAEFPYFYFVDGEEDFYLEKEREAKNAIVKIDGFEVEVPENKVKNIIPGITLDLKKAKPGEEFNIKISKDREAISLKINDLVDTINQVLTFIKQQNNIDESTDTSKTLGGDLILQTIESRLRAAIFKDVSTSSGYRRLGDLGITFQRDGILGIDQKKFDSTLAQDYQVASEILTGQIRSDGVKTDGFIDNFTKSINILLKFPNGVLINRDRSLQSKIDQIDRKIENRQRLISQKERVLKDKFARLEGVISKIQAQGAGIAALGSATVKPPPQLGS